MKQINDCYTLQNGVQIPCVGFGTYKAAEGNNTDIISMAIEAGYRYFDTASFYETEEYIGEAIRKSKIPREEFFLVSKLWKTEMGYEQALTAFEQSLKRLGTDYLDGYLIHWPLPYPDYEDWKTLDLQTWKALEEIYDSGRVRAIGLSNFLPHHIENILEHCKVKPMMNQLEVHPGYAQEVAVLYCQEQGIQMQGWSPIGRKRVFEDEMIQKMAEKYGVSIAQLCLRFSLQKGIIPLPKSSAMERMKQNQNIFSFEILKEDMYRLETMPQTGWSGEHPDRTRVKL